MKSIKIIFSLILVVLFIWASINLVYNVKNIDRDRDKLTDKREAFIGTNPLIIDTDKDGMNDFEEYNYWNNRSKNNITLEFYNFWNDYYKSNFNKTLTREQVRFKLLPEKDLDNDGYTNICDKDSDNDNITDYVEIISFTDPAFPEEKESSNANSDGEKNSDNGGEGGSDERKLTPTETYISYLSSKDIYKKDKFYARGYIIDENEKIINSIKIEIFINKTKDEPGILVGKGSVEKDDSFNITCEVPKEIKVGSNHVVAHSLGNEKYQDSWSDPLVNIYSETKIDLSILDSVGIKYPFTIKGYLLDIDNQPLCEKKIKIFWNNEEIGEPLTDNNGEFKLNYTHDKIGIYKITTLFEGEKYLKYSIKNESISLKDMSTFIEINSLKNETKRGDELNLRGFLYSNITSFIHDSEIKVYYNRVKISVTKTFSNGVFKDTITIPQESPLGENSLEMVYEGNKTYGGTRLEKKINVKSDTILYLNTITKKVYKENETLLISGILTDNCEKPIENATIDIAINNIKRSVKTDINGTFNVNHKITAESLNLYNLTARYKGTELYLPSSDSEIYPKTSATNKDINYNNILIIICIIIFLGVGGVVLSLIKKNKPKKINYSIREVALQTMNKLKDEGDLRKSILECYDSMCNLLDSSGLKKYKSQTPREFAVDIKKNLDVSNECLINLTQIFEKACYSKHEISFQERDKTIECLNEIVTSLENNYSNFQQDK